MCGAARFVLAVDCGSTNLKAALFDEACTRLAEESVPVDYTADSNGIVEFDGGMIRERFGQLVREICGAAGIDAGRVTDVAFDSQAQTFAMCDSDGEAVTPFYSWLDRRADKEAEDVDEALGALFHDHCSFAPPIAQLQICKMLWLKRHDPEACADGRRLVLLPSFLSWGLGAGNVTDRNLAAMGGAYSLREGTWWDEALHLCGMHAGQMPALVDVGGSVSVTEADESRFGEGTRIVFAGNDQTAGAYGNGCEKGGLVVTLGTALVAYRYAGMDPGPYHAGTFWGPYPEGAFYELSTIDEGCYALNWARKRILPDRPAAEFDVLARRVIDEDEQERAPLFFPRRIIGGDPWTEEGDASGMAYSVLEGIAFSLRCLVEETMEAKGEATIMSVTGGGARSAVWMQMIADVLDCPLRRGSGDSLLGAAAMALQRQGTHDGEGGADMVPDVEQHEVLDRRYRRWLGQV